MTEKKRIIIVDDHPLFRESAEEIIEQSTEFTVVGTAGDAEEAERLAADKKPELAVLDLSLPDRSGIQLSRSLKNLLPELKVVIVSMHSKIDYIMSALRAGALGYVVKESAAKMLVNALKTAAQGGYFLDPSLSNEVARKLIDFPRQQGANNSAYGTLTPREQEIIRLVAQGIPSKEIASRLFISAKTVTNHRTNIMNKLDLHNTAELVRYAAKLGLLDDIP